MKEEGLDNAIDNNNKNKTDKINSYLPYYLDTLYYNSYF